MPATIYIVIGIAGNLEMTKWMGLETVIPGEVSQTEKDKYCIISFIYAI